MLRELWVLLRNFVRDFSIATLRGTKEHWKGLLIFCTIGLVATVALAAVALKATASPKFCGLCHNMKAYIDSWEESSHKEVSCLECHFEPGVLGQLKGKWKAQAHVVMKLTGTAPPRPHTQISDASCLRQGCHAATDLTAADTTFLGVRFSHREHLGELRRGKRLRCVSCHSQIVQGQHLTVTESTCFLCHFYDRAESPELADCRTCHVQTRAKLFIDANDSLPFVHQEYLDRGVACGQCHFDVISGDGHLKDNVCVQCHAEPKILLSRQTSEAVHRDHVSLRKVDCLRCHAEIEHGIARETGPADRQPVVAPAGFGAYRYDANCVKCHSFGEHESIRRMYLGTGAEGLPDAPSPMYQAHADCGSCHVAQTETPAGPQGTLRLRYPDVIQACAECHGTGYDDMAKHWKKLLTEETIKAEGAVLEARQALGRVQSGAASDAARSLDVAERNLAFVRNGRGLHNVEYALGILGDARERAEESKSRVLPRYTPKEVASPTGCVELCHSCVECIETAPVPFGGVQFPHDLHVQDEGMGCLECHTPRDQHGQTFLANCSSCHHGSGAGAVECQDCHEENHNLFNGQNACNEASCDVTGEKNPMAEAVSCGECHGQVVEGEKTTPEGIKAACLECHDDDPSYAALVDEWKATADTLKVGELDAELQDLQRMVLRAIREGRYTYDAQDLVNSAEKNLKLLVKGNPVHNPVFAQDLAQRVTGLLKQARQTLRATSTVKTLPEEAYR
ncbi:MAG: cytochrome c3 family protein [Thermodesulfobacteriota bacterium]